MFLDGCVAVRENTPQTVSTLPIANPEGKPVINIVLTGKRWINETEVDADCVQQHVLPTWRKHVVKVFEESGLFHKVKLSARYSTDIHAEIMIQDRTDYNRPVWFLSAITLWMVPAKTTDTLLVTAVFKNKEGEVIARSEKTETVTAWRQFFLIYGDKIAGARDPLVAALEDLHRSILQEISHKINSTVLAH
jgi:hypothetical protein